MACLLNYNHALNSCPCVARERVCAGIYTTCSRVSPRSFFAPQKQLHDFHSRCWHLCRPQFYSAYTRASVLNTEIPARLLSLKFFLTLPIFLDVVPADIISALMRYVLMRCRCESRNDGLTKWQYRTFVDHRSAHCCQRSKTSIPGRQIRNVEHFKYVPFAVNMNRVFL